MQVAFASAYVPGPGPVTVNTTASALATKRIDHAHPEPQIDPAATVLLHVATGMLHAGRGQHESALEAFAAAARMESQLSGVHALAQVAISCESGIDFLRVWAGHYCAGGLLGGRGGYYVGDGGLVFLRRGRVSFGQARWLGASGTNDRMRLTSWPSHHHRTFFS